MVELRFKWFWAWGFVLLVSCSSSTTPNTLQTEGKILIIVRPDVRQETLAPALTQLGFSLAGGLIPLGASEGPCSGQLAAVAIDGHNPDEAEEALRALEAEFLLEPWGKAEDTSPLIDPRSIYSVDAMNYSEAIGVTEARNRGYGGQGITIAILDTGVTAHEDLAGRVLKGRSFVGEAEAESDIFVDSHSGARFHGTPIALLAAGTVSGVAPQATILPVRVCDERGSCPSPAVIQGLCFALNYAAETKSLKRMVFNLSWGSDKPSSIVKNILGYAGSQGVLMAAAAGNDYATNKNALNYPATDTLDGLLAVAALTQEGDTWLPAPYSNRGYHIDIAAPGDDLSLPTGTYSGTSFATALVAGSLALYRESFYLEQYTALDIEHALKSDAASLGEARREAVGTGLLNLRRLLDNRNVLGPVADRDNIHYDLFTEDPNAWPTPDLLSGKHEYFHVSSLSQGYVKFDLSKVERPITSARLLIYRDRAPPDDCTMKFYESSDNWTEGALASLPAKGQEIGAVIASASAYAEIDISSYAKTQQADGTLSIALDCSHEHWVIVGAREGQYAPKLILGFEE